MNLNAKQIITSINHNAISLPETYDCNKPFDKLPNP
jgi:hypothetical protein